MTFCSLSPWLKTALLCQKRPKDSVTLTLIGYRNWKELEGVLKVNSKHCPQVSFYLNTQNIQVTHMYDAHIVHQISPLLMVDGMMLPLMYGGSITKRCLGTAHQGQ